MCGRSNVCVIVFAGYIVVYNSYWLSITYVLLAIMHDTLRGTITSKQLFFLPGVYQNIETLYES